MNREQIYSALFDKVSGAANFKTKSRKLRHWSDVPQGEQPALFMVQTGEAAETIRGQPTRWTLRVDLYLYVRTTGASIPAQQINPLLDAVVATLAPSGPDNVQTLGGLVHRCWIEGQIETDEGSLGDQAVVIIPIIIFTA